MKFIKCKLSELGEIVGGSTPFTKNESYYGGDIPWLTPKDLANFNGRYINFGERNITEAGYKSTSVKMLPINSVLFSSRAPIGYVAINNKNEVCTNQGFKSVIPNSKTDYMFLYYLLKYNKNKIEAMGSGTTFKEVSGAVMKNIIVNVPEAKEDQIKIGKILSKIDDKIELNTHTNDNLYEITNKLYEQLFVVERQDDWKEYNLQELMDISNGYSYTGKELVDASVFGMATIKNFERTGGFKEEGFKDIEPVKAKDNHYADKFDILVACTDLTQNADIIGNAVMLLNTGKYEKIVISMDLVKILPKKNKYLVFSILNSKEFKNFALGYKTGTTVLHLNKNCFKDFNIKLPDLDKLEEFEKVVEVNYKKISSNLEENNTLTQLRDTLLPKLMNGEIDLDKIEI